MILVGALAADVHAWPDYLAVLAVVALVWPFHLPLAEGVEIYLPVRWVGSAAAYVLGFVLLPVYGLASIPGFLLIAALDRNGLLAAHGIAAENLCRLRGEPYPAGTLVEGNLRQFVNMSGHLLRAAVVAALRWGIPAVPFWISVAVAETAVVVWERVAPIPGRMAPGKIRARLATTLGPDMLVVLGLLDLAMVCFLLLAHAHGGTVGFVVASLSTVIFDAILTRLNDARLESERRRREVVTMREQLSQRERLAALGQTASAVFHQIARQHGTIGIYAHLLARSAGSENGGGPDPQLAAVVRDHTECILASVEEANRVIDELLRFGQDRTLNLYPQSVAAIVAETAAQCRPRAASRAIEIVVDADPDTPIPVDKHKLTQALGNVLDNAVDASPDGGRVEVASALDDGGVRVTVRDGGAGIAPEIKERLFAPFATTKPQGIGLGLALAKELVEAHGGSIDWQDANPGTRFVIRLPAPAAVAT
jgi:signal transduction histidine kinase